MNYATTASRAAVPTADWPRSVAEAVAPAADLFFSRGAWRVPLQTRSDNHAANAVVVPGVGTGDYPLRTPGLAAVSSILAALQRDGCAVLEHAVPEDICDAVFQELQAYEWSAETQVEAGNTTSKRNAKPVEGKTSGVIGAAISRSPSSAAMVAHPVVVAVVEAVLG